MPGRQHGRRARSCAVAESLLALLGPAGVQDAAGPASLSSDAAVTQRTDSSCFTNGSYVMKGASNVCFVWYGGCGGTRWLRLRSTPYFQINSGYPDASGGASKRRPNLRREFGGSVLALNEVVIDAGCRVEESVKRPLRPLAQGEVCTRPRG